MLHSFTIFEAIYKLITSKVEKKPVTSNEGIGPFNVDNYDIIHSYKYKDVVLVHGEYHYGTDDYKPENKTSDGFMLIWYGKEVLSYTTDQYSTEFSSDDTKLYELYQELIGIKIST